MKDNFIKFIIVLIFAAFISPSVHAQATSNACTDKCVLLGSPNDCALYGMVADGTCEESYRPGVKGVMCKCPQGSGTPKPTAPASSLPKDAVLQFDKRAVSVKPGDTFDVQVIVNAGTNKIIGTDAVLNFDKTLLQYQSKKDGTFFPTVVGSDSEERLRFSGIVEDPSTFKTGSGTLVTLTFKALKEGTDSISYFCSATDSEASKVIASDDNSTDVLNCTANTKVIFSVSNSSPTISPLPTQPDSCVCKTDNTCDTSCNYSSTPSAGLKCNREASLGADPDAATKNNYCRRFFRVAGDADGDGKISSIDYLYYVRAVNGGTIAAEVNPDFNGDGLVSPSDRAIIVSTLKDLEPAITTTPVPTSSETQPTPTQIKTSATPTPSAMVSISPTTAARPTLIQPTLKTQQCSAGFSCLTNTECLAKKGGATGISCGATLFCCYINQ